MSIFTEFNSPASLEWIGKVSNPTASIRSSTQTQARLTYGGLEGDSHHGLTRPACVRVKDLYPEDTPIRNVRQLSIVSLEDLDLIADEMEMERIVPELLGANLVVRGIPDFTLIPPSTRLQFASGATVTIDMINLPCNFPAREIEKENRGKGKAFKSAARNRRGVTAWVEREGLIFVGDRVKVFVPMQDRWPHA